MNVFRLGMKYRKKYLPDSIVAEFISFFVLTADLLMPLFSEMFIDYCIGDSEPDTSGVFGFLLPEIKNKILPELKDYLYKEREAYI